MDQSFTKEVEDEANSYFQRIYNHPPNPTISIDEVLEMLKKFKDSPVKKERVGAKFPYHFYRYSCMNQHHFRGKMIESFQMLKVATGGGGGLTPFNKNNCFLFW